MSPTLSEGVRAKLRGAVAARYVTFPKAAEAMDQEITWLRRRLNGGVKLTLDDLELICSRLDIPLAEVTALAADCAGTGGTCRDQG